MGFKDTGVQPDNRLELILHAAIQVCFCLSKLLKLTLSVSF